jgi:hypothetical protein
VPYTLRYVPEKGWTESRLEGEILPSQARGYVDGVMALLAKQKARGHLTDFRDARPRLNTVDFIDLARMVEESAAEHGVSIHSIRRALIGPKGDPDATFYETVFLNRGHHNMRLFSDEEEARRWLERGCVPSAETP